MHGCLLILFLCSNRADIAKLLLDKRAYVGSENALGMRPLSIAAATGNCRVLSLLVNPGLPFQHLNAKVSERGMDGRMEG